MAFRPTVHRSSYRPLRASRRPATAWRFERLSYAAAAFLGWCLLLGGGGPHAPLNTMLVELAAMAMLAALFALPVRYGAPRISYGAWALLAAVLLLFAAQLIPLPAAWWSALPGRQLLVQALTIEQGPPLPAHALSIDPGTTFDTLFDLLVPIASFAVACRIETPGRDLLAGVIVAAALVGVILEAVQFAGGLSNLYVSEGPNSLPTGLFANHNHQACFLAVAIVMLRPIGDRLLASRPAFVVTGAVVVVHLVLLVGVVATQSRAGAFLTILASIWLGLGYWRWWRRGATDRQNVVASTTAQSIPRWALPFAAVAIVGAGVLAFESTPAQQFIGRFSDLQDQRTAYLPNLWSATATFLPWGSGLGSYPIVFHAYEDLNLLGPTFFNHAHDDYYELLMEAGYPAMALLAGFIVFFVASCVVVMRQTASEASLARAAIVATVLMLLHSAVDYPLRTHTMAATFGFALALLALRAPYADRS